MKHLSLVMLISFILNSCTTLQKDNTQDFIPGIYVREIKQEFAVGMDTINISLLDKHASTYKIIRKSGYRQMVDGRLMAPKWEVHHWLGFYDAEKEQLTEPNNERTFTFLPDKNTLLMGTSQYIKVNKMFSPKTK